MSFLGFGRTNHLIGVVVVVVRSRSSRAANSLRLFLPAQRGSDELLAQSGGVSNGTVMSPAQNHVTNNNDAKKVSFFFGLGGAVAWVRAGGEPRAAGEASAGRRRRRRCFRNAPKKDRRRIVLSRFLFSAGAGARVPPRLITPSPPPILGGLGGSRAW